MPTSLRSLARRFSATLKAALDPSADHLEAEVKLLPVIVDHNVKSPIGRLGHTLASVGAYATFGVLTALALLLRHHIAGFDEAFGASLTTNEILDHLGNAFLVSAIVICMYEWGSELKRSVTLSGKLADTLYAHIHTVIDGSSQEQLANSVKELSRVKNELFTKALKDFAEALRTLSEGDWTAAAYQEFLLSNHQTLRKDCSQCKRIEQSQCKNRVSP
jgi:hypothetical protein